jgi:hypothetical protein
MQFQNDNSPGKDKKISKFKAIINKVRFKIGFIMKTSKAI